MTRVAVLKNTVFDGSVYMANDVFDCDDALAATLIDAGIVEIEQPPGANLLPAPADQPETADQP